MTQPIVDWGKYAITDPVEYHFKNKPEWTWSIKPPTSGDELDMARFLNRGKTFVGNEGISRDEAPNWIEIAYREIALTYAGTNVTDVDEKPVLKDNASVSDIEKFLKRIPHDIVLELWEAIADTVPGWGGRRKQTDSEKADPNE